MYTGERNFAVDYNFKYLNQSQSSFEMLCIGSRGQLHSPCPTSCLLQGWRGKFFADGKIRIPVAEQEYKDATNPGLKVY